MVAQALDALALFLRRLCMDLVEASSALKSRTASSTAVRGETPAAACCPGLLEAGGAPGGSGEQ